MSDPREDVYLLAAMLSDIERVLHPLARGIRGQVRPGGPVMPPALPSAGSAGPGQRSGSGSGGPRGAAPASGSAARGTSLAPSAPPPVPPRATDRQPARENGWVDTAPAAATPAPPRDTSGRLAPPPREHAQGAATRAAAPARGGEVPQEVDDAPPTSATAKEDGDTTLRTTPPATAPTRTARGRPSVEPIEIPDRGSATDQRTARSQQSKTTSSDLQPAVTSDPGSAPLPPRLAPPPTPSVSEPRAALPDRTLRLDAETLLSADRPARPSASTAPGHPPANACRPPPPADAPLAPPALAGAETTPLASTRHGSSRSGELGTPGQRPPERSERPTDPIHCARFELDPVVPPPPLSAPDHQPVAPTASRATTAPPTARLWDGARLPASAPSLDATGAPGTLPASAASAPPTSPTAPTRDATAASEIEATPPWDDQEPWWADGLFDALEGTDRLGGRTTLLRTGGRTWPMSRMQAERIQRRLEGAYLDRALLRRG